MSKHQKLNLKTAITMADVMAKVTLQEVMFTHISCKILMTLIGRFAWEPPMQEYAKNFVKLALRLVEELERKKKAAPKSD